MSVISDEHFHNEAVAYKWVEAHVWPDGPVCPKCGESHRVSKMEGKSTRIGTYKCYSCRKPFTVKVGTIFEDSHVQMHKWLQAFYLLASSKKGISANQLHRTLKVTLRTAWFMAHRIREAMRTGDLAPPLAALAVPASSRLTRLSSVLRREVASPRAATPTSTPCWL